MMKIVTQKMLVGQGLHGFIGFGGDLGEISKVRGGNGGVQIVGVLRLRECSAAQSTPFAQDDRVIFLIAGRSLHWRGRRDGVGCHRHESGGLLLC